MRLHSDHHDHSAQSDLPAELRRLDEAIAELSARDHAPPGLTDRVFRASVGALPPRLRLRGGASRGSPQRRVRVHHRVWGQLAMAASIGLTFLLVAWFLAAPRGGERGAIVAEHTPRSTSAVHTIAQHTAMPLTPEAEWLLLESGFNGRASHLSETRDLTFAELRSESQRLFDELEL